MRIRSFWISSSAAIVEDTVDAKPFVLFEEIPEAQACPGG
jgi:hypothetical protein